MVFFQQETKTMFQIRIYKLFNDIFYTRKNNNKRNSKNIILNIHLITYYKVSKGWVQKKKKAN